MESLKANLFFKLIFVSLFAIIVNIFIYFAFGNVYSAPLFDIDSFKEQYESGVYQYRWLSTYLLIYIYDFLESLPFRIKLKMDFWDKNAQPNMFFAYAFLNTFFLILSNIILLLITETKYFLANQSEKIFIITISTLSIGISQFVLVPYDCSSYFFLFAFVLVFLKYLENKKNILLLLLIIILVISTLNRESSALSLSFAAVILYQLFGLKKESLIPIGYLTISFLATYILVRFVADSFDVRNENFFLGNIRETRSRFGILFWIVFFIFSLLVSNNKQTTKNILIFHLFSLPYIFMCFYTGALYEIRLYIPIFLSCLIFSKLSFDKIKIN
ncbi:MULTISPECIES: hypothetical protein [Epilithonimonas]|uniref:EpsG family protein n=2 Tax=Epilithonimonas hominis TaxID=420404 RepID=A0A3N0XAZ6_9FLAO|nr:MULTISPECIES: hypothetical protein [Epilithonimonas]ROI14557.1 hypothetical protein EGH73_02530 [Epilithonimonas hominis]UQB70086.1 hypothetical protein KI430_06565 [Epilithonimonas zeae]